MTAPRLPALSPHLISNPDYQRIRAQYLAQRIDLAEAVGQLTVAGQIDPLTATQLLARPMSVERIQHWAGVAVTEQQMVDRAELAWQAL